LETSPIPYRPDPVALAVPVRIAAGSIGQVDLLASRAAVSASLVRVYDPVGNTLDNSRRHPRSEPEYGATRGRDVFVYAEVDLESAGLRNLPTGEVTVFERGSAGLLPLGSAMVFEAKREEEEQIHAQTPARLRLPIGLAPELSGKREQADFAFDAQRRRLLEEIRVTLENRGDDPAEVLVREHLYRGLNWALVYYNQVGPVEKTGPQELQIRMRVPAHRKVMAAYRVAYTW
jgi:hypothetical protein